MVWHPLLRRVFLHICGIRVGVLARDSNVFFGRDHGGWKGYYVSFPHPFALRYLMLN